MKQIELIGAGLITFGAGVLAGHFLGKRELEREYEERANSEIEKARDYYKRTIKAEEYSDPEALSKSLGYNAMGIEVEAVDVTDEMKEAIEALRNYRGTPEPVGDTIVEGVDLEDQLPEAEEQLKEDAASGRVSRNLFAEYSDREWDYEVEKSKRETPGPYVLHVDEFNANENEWDQAELTFFEGDGVLCDVRDDPIPAIDKVVGEGNLFRFGHGGADKDTVYVRNEDMKMEWEITRSDGKFAEVVLGIIAHSDDYMPRRKRRLED